MTNNVLFCQPSHVSLPLPARTAEAIWFAEQMFLDEAKFQRKHVSDANSAERPGTGRRGQACFPSNQVFVYKRRSKRQSLVN